MKRLFLLFVLFACFVGISFSATTNIISQYGITWYFDSEYEYGQFANGDYWVMGNSVIIDSITPHFDGTYNGWEVNPQYDLDFQWGTQGFDGRITQYFDDSLIPDLPYTARPGESVIKAISYLDGPCGGWDRYCLSTAAVLTVVGEVPPDNGATVFRPPYVGSEKPYYSIDSLRTDLLPANPRISSAPTLAWVEDRFKRLQMHHEPGNTGRSIAPIENYHDFYGGGGARYGPIIGTDNSEGALALMLDDPIEDKMPALINYIQMGIDWIYIVKQGKTWTIGGAGIQPGFKIPTVFAATMLDDDSLKSIVMNSHFPENENLQKQNNVSHGALYGVQNQYWSEFKYWDYIIKKDTGQPISTSAYKDPYGYIDGEIPERGYIFIYIVPWKGAALAGNLMPKLKTVWNNPLLFDFIDRWVNIGYWTQPDLCAPHDGNIDNYGITFGPDGQGGCILDTDSSDGIGRYPELHGTDTNEEAAGYGSDFITESWDSYRGASCYDGVCNGDETPETCPYDCDAASMHDHPLITCHYDDRTVLCVTNNPLVLKSQVMVIEYLASDTEITNLAIYSISGVKTNKLMVKPGLGSCVWDGTDHWGQRVKRGMYYICLQTGTEKYIKKIAVIE